MYAQQDVYKRQHMGSEELAANLFRATQTDAKLRRDGIQGKDNANKTHFEVGQKDVYKRQQPCRQNQNCPVKEGE